MNDELKCFRCNEPLCFIFEDESFENEDEQVQQVWAYCQCCGLSFYGNTEQACRDEIALLNAERELAKATLWWDVASLSEEASSETIQLAEEERDLAIAKVRELESGHED